MPWSARSWLATWASRFGTGINHPQHTAIATVQTIVLRKRAVNLRLGIIFNSLAFRLFRRKRLRKWFLHRWYSSDEFANLPTEREFDFQPREWSLHSWTAPRIRPVIFASVRRLSHCTLIISCGVQMTGAWIFASERTLSIKCLAFEGDFQNRQVS